MSQPESLGTFYLFVETELNELIYRAFIPHGSIDALRKVETYHSNLKHLLLRAK